MPAIESIASVVPGGASSAAARSRAELSELPRRLPEMPIRLVIAGRVRSPLRARGREHFLVRQQARGLLGEREHALDALVGRLDAVLLEHPGDVRLAAHRADADDLL